MGAGSYFIIYRIDNEYCLYMIAKGDYILQFRILAINKISEKSVLEDIAANYESHTIRNFASKRLDVL